MVSSKDLLQEDWERISDQEKLLIQLEKEYKEAMDFEEANLILTQPIKQVQNGEEATIQYIPNHSQKDGGSGSGTSTRILSGESNPDRDESPEGYSSQT